MFAVIGAALFLMEAVSAFRAHGAGGARTLGATLLRFVDIFASMTAELTLLLATLSILTGAFVTTGVPPKIGFILVEVLAAAERRSLASGIADASVRQVSSLRHRSKC